MDGADDKFPVFDECDVSASCFSMAKDSVKAGISTEMEVPRFSKVIRIAFFKEESAKEKRRAKTHKS